MFLDHISLVSSELQLKNHQVENTQKLLDGGATVPFIARYRKEATGGLDEVQIDDIKQLLNKWNELQKRKEAIINSIQEQGKLSDEVLAEIKS
ncbi:MAG: RNA-binding transcriptional accessory protein, partial [Bacteroidetes bacterium]|nr:RNA-binding transcriptional accessory protein [Bacteroidota bacterium]